MADKDWITKIANRHSDWVFILKSLGADYYAEDIVQEMYITLMRTSSEAKAFRNGEVYIGYIYTCLKNSYLNYLKKKNKITKVPINDVPLTQRDIDYNTQTIQEKEDFEMFSNKIRNILFEKHWYLEGIYNIYTSPDDPSYREIARATTISFMTIYNDMKRIKELIQDKPELQSQWQKI